MSETWVTLRTEPRLLTVSSNGTIVWFFGSTIMMYGRKRTTFAGEVTCAAARNETVSVGLADKNVLVLDETTPRVFVALDFVPRTLAVRGAHVFVRGEDSNHTHTLVNYGRKYPVGSCDCRCEVGETRTDDGVWSVRREQNTFVMRNELLDEEITRTFTEPPSTWCVASGFDVHVAVVFGNEVCLLSVDA